MIAQEALEELLFAPPREGVERLTVSQGEWPGIPRGSYYLNGPSNLQKNDFRYQHWLDGDGFVQAVHFDDQGGELVSKFVRTRKFQDETEANTPIYRAFGTAFSGDQLRRGVLLESPANVSVFFFAGRLLAFGEQALPWELDPVSLETLGEVDFSGALSEVTPLSAHPKFDESNGRLCNFGVKYLLKNTSLCYWEFDENFECMISRELPWEEPYSVHDFVLSERFAAFYLSPYKLDISRFVRKRDSIAGALQWEPDENNVLYLIPRDKDGDAISISLGARGFCLHLIGAHETGDKLVVDFIETSEPLYPQYEGLPNLFATVKPGAFVRMEVDIFHGTIIDTIEFPIPECHLDFPVTRPGGAGQDWVDVWVLALPVHNEGKPKYFDRLQRFSWTEGRVVDEYRPAHGCYLAGEPCLLESPDNPSGKIWLICPEWDSVCGATDYLIFDAYRLESGPVSKLSASLAAPLGFHSSFKRVN